MLVNDSSTNCAEHDIDPLENTGNCSLVGIVDLGKFSTLREPFWVVGFDGVLISGEGDVVSEIVERRSVFWPVP